MKYHEYEIYGTSTCKWCDEAKKLLTENGQKFKFHNIENPAHLAEFKELFPGRTSVPQILGWNFNGVVHSEMGGEYEDQVSTHIAGYDELKALFK